jgi:hypothetical protein
MVMSNFFENSLRYSQVKVHYRYQLQQWQTTPVYVYVNFSTQRCPNKIFKTFLIEEAANISANFSKKLETTILGYSGA